MVSLVNHTMSLNLQGLFNPFDRYTHVGSMAEAVWLKWWSNRSLVKSATSVRQFLSAFESRDQFGHESVRASIAVNSCGWIRAIRLGGGDASVAVVFRW